MLSIYLLFSLFSMVMATGHLRLELTASNDFTLQLRTPISHQSLSYLTESIKNATQIASLSPDKGLWIIGSDATWQLASLPAKFTLPQDAITGFTFPAPLIEGHGWYLTRDSRVTGMEYGGERCGEGEAWNLLILSFLYLPSAIACQFLRLYSEFPATTYLGVDSNVTPSKLSLFFDFMLSTCISESEFLKNRLGAHQKIAEDPSLRARRQIYSNLRGYCSRIETLDIRDYQYKAFNPEVRDYGSLAASLDNERGLRTQLSLSKIQGLTVKQAISRILSTLRAGSQDQLQTIFSASLALSLASEGKGGLRNGPAKNPIFEKLMQEKLMQGPSYLTAIFDEILANWISDPSRMIRAARHLETAAQKCIREKVEGLCAEV
uniref:TFR_dimer domain-containing protein n=1 Tax=Caenorhabditis tropicalis TaxID=1561998 RepID=A0A1I7U2H4_9PELO